MNRFINRNIVYNGALFLKGEWIYPHLASLHQSQWEINSELQEQRLALLCSAARKNSEYYRRILPEKVTLDSLSSLPFLEKKELRDNCAGLRAVCSKFDRLKTTGGSTGAPVTVYKNSQAMGEELAATWRGYQWAGVNIGDRQGRFWGVPASRKDLRRAQLTDLICNRFRISAFSRTDNEWHKAYVALCKFCPDYFYGYTSMLKEFADYSKSFKNRIKPKAVITTSEVLTEPDKNFISEVFSCRVFNEYGCGEVGTIAHECEHGRLHINAENLIIEVVDETGQLVPAEVAGELVVTDLSNTAMPLIRYRLADWGVLANELCPCGRTLPVLEYIYGRAYDSLVNTVGRKFHGEFFLYIIEDAKKQGMHVDGVQFEQGRSGELTIRIVANEDDFSNLKPFIHQRIQKHFDSQVVIHFENVEKIMREASGKLRVVKREV